MHLISATLTDANVSTEYTTNTVTITGINVSVTATTDIGTFIVNGVDSGAFATIDSGDTLAVKLTSSSDYSDTQGVEVNVGEGTDSFVLTTKDNTPPKWEEPSYDTGLTITDANDDVIVIMDLNPECSDVDGHAITYEIIDIDVPHAGEQSKWDNSLVIEAGVLKVKNLMKNNPNEDGTVTATVRAIDVGGSGGSNNTDVTFIFEDVQ